MPLFFVAMHPKEAFGGRFCWWILNVDEAYSGKYYRRKTQILQELCLEKKN
jgi:hypothetical protein